MWQNKNEIIVFVLKEFKYIIFKHLVCGGFSFDIILLYFDCTYKILYAW